MRQPLLRSVGVVALLAAALCGCGGGRERGEMSEPGMLIGGPDGRGSMIRPAGLRKAIADLEGRQLGVETWTFRLAPERIDATFVKKGLRHVQLRFDGTFQRFSVSRGNYAHLPTVNISELDVRAPQRLVRAAARRIGKPTSRIDYLIPQADGWIAYFKGGQYFKGDRHGKVLRRIS